MAESDGWKVNSSSFDSVNGSPDSRRSEQSVEMISVKKAIL